MSVLLLVLCFLVTSKTLPSNASLLLANLTSVTGFESSPPVYYIWTAELNITNYETDRQSRIDFVFNQSGLDQILGIYLTYATYSLNTSILIDFTSNVNLSTLQENGSFSGSLLADKNITKGMTELPDLYTLVVATQNYADGTIKGPLYDPLSNVTLQFPYTELDAFMSFDQVLPTNGTEGGEGGALLSIRTSNSSATVNFQFFASNFSGIVSVGLYAGEYGSVGPLLLNFTPAIDLLAFDFNGFTVGVLEADLNVISEILSNVSSVYCQIDSFLSLKGAVRGNLHRLFLDFGKKSLPPPKSPTKSAPPRKKFPPPSKSTAKSPPPKSTGTNRPRKSVVKSPPPKIVRKSPPLVPLRRLPPAKSEKKSPPPSSAQKPPPTKTGKNVPPAKLAKKSPPPKLIRKSPPPKSKNKPPPPRRA